MIKFWVQTLGGKTTKPGVIRGVMVSTHMEHLRYVHRNFPLELEPLVGISEVR